MNHNNYNNFHERLLIFPDLLPMGMQIKLKRCAENLRQSDIAKILDCSPSTVALFENGKRPIPRKSIEKARRYLYSDVYTQGIKQERWTEND